MLLDQWEPLERPGYLGAERDGRIAQYNEDFSAENWCFGWHIGQVYVPIEGAVALYEDAYLRFLSAEANRLQLVSLVNEAANVYDDNPSNVASGLDYSIQETNRTHLQDIAIRRCLVRMGLWFVGKELIPIRDKLGPHPLSFMLSPGRVPFHQPGLIDTKEGGELQGWWWPASVESFYQSNRYVMVRR